MIRFELPLKTPSVANLREHHMAKAKRVASQRRAAMLKCPKWNGGPLLVVTLTRVAPHRLDSDNLAAALKGVRDGIASRLGVDDGSALVRWEYAQESGDEAVRVDIRRAEVAIQPAPPDCHSDRHSHCARCGSCEPILSCVCYSR